MSHSERLGGHVVPLEDAQQAAQTFNDPRFWRWLTLGVGLLAFGKGIRLPNAWSYTQAQMDYSVGFMRRGLFGEVLGHALQLNRYTNFAIVSTLLLLLLYGALALLAHRSRLAARTPPGELLAVYASSYSVTYLAHLNGYMDSPLALLCVAPLFVRSTGWRLAAAAVCATLGILVHEQFIFCYLPVLVISVLLGAEGSKSVGERRLAWAGAALLLLLGLGMTGLLGRYASITVAQEQQLSRSAAARADQPISADVFDVLPRTTHENFEIMKTVWVRPTFIPAQVESLLLFGPTAGVLVWGTFVVLRRWRPGASRWVYAAVVVGTLAPLSLNLVGWDKNRWNEMMALNALLLLLVVCMRFGDEPIRLPVGLRRACLAVMLLNMASGGGMLDFKHVRPFPFLRNPDSVEETSHFPS
jgi:hypothetical protein